MERLLGLPFGTTPKIPPLFNTTADGNLSHVKSTLSTTPQQNFWVRSDLSSNSNVKCLCEHKRMNIIHIRFYDRRVAGSAMSCLAANICLRIPQSTRSYCVHCRGSFTTIRLYILCSRDFIIKFNIKYIKLKLKFSRSQINSYGVVLHLKNLEEKPCNALHVAYFAHMYFECIS